MKIAVFALCLIGAAFSYEKTSYPFFEGKSHDEIRTYYLGLNTDFDKDTMLSMFLEPKIENANLPDNFDWREKMGSCVHPVRDQGHCGSCWAHAASEVFSDRACIQSNGKIDMVFSPQQLVNCDYLEMGCSGGFLTTPFIYYSLIGAQDESCFGEYKSGETGGRTSFCFLKKWSCPVVRANLMSIKWLTSPQAIKEDLYKNGPVNTGFKVYDDFLIYKSGIYSQQSQKLLGGHAVKIVGWGKENDVEYWIVQNSWTASWGEKGFFKIKMGECGIDSGAVSVNPSL